MKYPMGHNDILRYEVVLLQVRHVDVAGGRGGWRGAKLLQPLGADPLAEIGELQLSPRRALIKD